jgi:hypothetical protein
MPTNCRRLFIGSYSVPLKDDYVFQHSVQPISAYNIDIHRSFLVRFLTTPLTELHESYTNEIRSYGLLFYTHLLERNC